MTIQKPLEVRKINLGLSFSGVHIHLIYESDHSISGSFASVWIAWRENCIRLVRRSQPLIERNLRFLSIVTTRFPSGVLKPSNKRCGYASEIVPPNARGRSCLKDYQVLAT